MVFTPRADSFPAPLKEPSPPMTTMPSMPCFLQIAESFNKKTVNGLAMLFYQAYYSACIFADLPADVKQAEILFEEYKREQL